MEITYITTRDLENKAGHVEGKVRVIVLKGESDANIDYTCPECGFKEKKKSPWVKPFSFICSKCNLKIKVSGLKSEIKKDKNKNKV